MSFILDWLRSRDEVVLPFHESLHAGEEVEQETLIGGCSSFLVRSYVWYIMITQGIRMFELDGPGIVS